jgi:hypothetical protein
MIVFVLLVATHAVVAAGGIYVGYKYGRAAVVKALEAEAAARAVVADAKKVL